MAVDPDFIAVIAVIWRLQRWSSSDKNCFWKLLPGRVKKDIVIKVRGGTIDSGRIFGMNSFPNPFGPGLYSGNNCLSGYPKASRKPELRTHWITSGRIQRLCSNHGILENPKGP